MLLKLQEGVSPVEEGKSLEYYLREEYTDTTIDWKLLAYYTLKPAIPRFVQLALRRMYSPAKSTGHFPHWPVESVVTEKVAVSLRRAIEARSSEPVHRIGYWPEGKKFAFVITHDVEWDEGLRRAPRIVELEKDLGFVSSWNLVPERYPIDWSIVDHIRNQGYEIGVHGLKHDGKLFKSQRIFKSRLVKIHKYAEEWGSVGFRSPSTLRNVQWMPELKFEYDSSFMDTDPYEPQPGGCCSIWPFFIDSLLELPITVPQDHTLLEILREKDLLIWKIKADWIGAHGGMVLINVHPDYMDSDDRLKMYEQFLVYLKTKRDMWHALPRDVARWWKDRSRTTLVMKKRVPELIGPAAQRARVVRHWLDRGTLCEQLLSN